MTISPFYIDAAQLRGVRNMKADTYPAEPLLPEDLHTKALVVAVPKPLWHGDWIVDLENDISWISDKFDVDKGGMLFIKEKHRFHIKKGLIEVEYADGLRKETDRKEWEVRFTDRWLSPVCMPRWAARFILEVKEIETRWMDEKRTQLAWIIGVTRKDNVDQLIKQYEAQ